MITLGIDLASMPETTAACIIRWENERAIAESPYLCCEDRELDRLIGRSDVVGVDAPFGWPHEFVAAVGSWQFRSWNQQIRDRLRFRETDRQIKTLYGLAVLSVSADRIALPAMRAMAMLHRHNVIDRSGVGKFFEVYPKGSLKALGLPFRGYRKANRNDIRTGILNRLREAMPWLEASDSFAKSPDSLDSLIASLTARAAVQQLTVLPRSNQKELAREEGWIHIPLEFPRCEA